LTKSGFKYSDYSIDIFTSINEADSDNKWSAFKTDFLTGSYLKVLEQSNPSDLQFRYLMISNSHGETCGIIYFQLLKFSGKNIHLKKSPFLSILVNLALGICPFKLLICGNVFAVNFKPYCFHEEKISETDITKIVEEYTKLEKSDAILLKDFGVNFSNNLLYSMGYQNYTADLTMCMDVKHEWNSIDDYKHALTKKYRRRFEKITASASTLKREELTISTIVKYKETLFKLFKHVSAKQTMSMGLINKNYFEEFKAAFPERFKVVGYFEGEELIAFCTYIDRNDLLEVHYIGMDYSMNEKYNLYFNILFDSLKLAISERKSQLELGRTAREAKANLGSKAVYFNDYMKLNSSLAIKAADWLSQNFQKSMGEEWQKRNPFRKE